MIGTKTSARWIYRGDSYDILKDNKHLHLDPPLGQPKFGNILRCSACHNSGGPIMKELAPPHNDWWTKERPLVFPPNTLSEDVSKIVDQLLDAKYFANSVQQGMNKLNSSETFNNFKAQISLQEQLRPLFCEIEINLESDILPLENIYNKVQLPKAFLLNPLLGQINRVVDKSDYMVFLNKYKLKFPETNFLDADHAWLTPVKASSEISAIIKLIESKVISESFAKAVLSLDLANPIFSKERCGLLKLVPENKSNSWLVSFKEKLKLRGTKASLELLKYLNQPDLIEQHIGSYLNAPINSEVLFVKLLEVRKSTFDSEMSQNPLGQIMEPGFRVIFPTPNVIVP